MRGDRWAWRAEIGTLNYEGLPPEVGAFKSKKWPHAPWPVHNFTQKCQIYGNSRTLGVGVIPWLPGVSEGLVVGMGVE